MLSLFSARSIGFSGSRSPSLAAAAALSDLLPFVPSGSRVSVGCADGVDRLVRSFFSESPSLLVFSVESGRFGSGRSAFARRSIACVRSIARGDSDLPSWSLPGAALLWGRLRFLGVRSLCSWLRAARSYLAAWLGSPCLGRDRMGALGFFLVARASPSPPGSVISFLVFLYYARLFPPGLCLIIP